MIRWRRWERWYSRGRCLWSVEIPGGWRVLTPGTGLHASSSVSSVSSSILEVPLWHGSWQPVWTEAVSRSIWFSTWQVVIILANKMEPCLPADVFIVPTVIIVKKRGHNNNWFGHLNEVTGAHWRESPSIYCCFLELSPTGLETVIDHGLDSTEDEEDIDQTHTNIAHCQG